MNNDPFPSMKKQLSDEISALETSIRRLIELRQVNASTEYTEGDIQINYEKAQRILDTVRDTNDRVSANPTRFAYISPEELHSRQQFVETSQKRLNDIKMQLNKPTKAATPQSTSISDRKEHLKHLREKDNQKFIDDEFGYQNQMYAEQDQKIDVVGQQAQDLNQMADQIHNVLLDDEARRNDIDKHLDRTQVNLERLIDKTKQLLDNPRTWLWAGCIVLTIIVIVLIIWVFVF